MSVEPLGPRARVAVLMAAFLGLAEAYLACGVGRSLTVIARPAAG